LKTCFSLLLLLLLLGACERVPGGEANRDRELAKKEQEQRERKARVLLQQGMAAEIRQKLKIYAALIARYPHSKAAPEAWFRLIRHLFDEPVRDRELAFKRAVAFGRAYPELARPSECFYWLWIAGVKSGEKAFLKRVKAAWSEFLSRALAAQQTSKQDQAFLRYHRALLAELEGRKREAVKLYEEAEKLLPLDGDRRTEMQIYTRLGILQAGFKELRPAARKSFQRALDMLSTWKSTLYNEQQIHQLMKQAGL